jgi:preprotein translocase subunit SecY
MWDRLRSIWTIPDLRNKILFTLGMLLVFRLVGHVPVPGIDPQNLQAALGRNPQYGQLFGLLDVFSGGSLQTFSVAAMGVYPYITASIVMQLIVPIFPRLEALQREGGEAGRTRISQYTRVLSVPLAFLQAFGQSAILVQLQAIPSGQFNLFSAQTFLPTFATLVTLTTGTMFLVWLGEVITENGIGNGISLIIFAGIVSRLPGDAGTLFVSTSAGGVTNTTNIVQIVVFLAVVTLVILSIVLIYQAQRRVPVQYPTKRMVGRDRYAGASQMSYIPLQVNMAGMIPLIFAQSMLLFPVILSSYLAFSSNKAIANFATNVSGFVQQTNPWYWVIFFVLVVAFTFFYATVLWQQQNLPENLQKQGAIIPGIRPGQKTQQYLDAVLRRITLAGAIFLGVLAIIPAFFPNSLQQVFSTAALLIAVGVVLDTMKQLEGQMVMRNYSGFLR